MSLTICRNAGDNTIRPMGIKLQPRPAYITGSQKPMLEAPKLLGKRLTSGCFSSKSNCKPSSMKATVKPKTDSYHQTKSSLAPKQVLSESSGNSAFLKDRANKQFVGETQIKIPPVKSQQLSRGTNLARPGEKLPKIVSSPYFLSRTHASKKLVVKDIKDIKVNGDKHERPNETKLQSHTITEQKVEQTLVCFWEAITTDIQTLSKVRNLLNVVSDLGHHVHCKNQKP
ncbi:hypothetical protein GH733_011892 [Mirounga leonina]|nr:hypothetical protein GH733_011892 [Mirounga leonina]